MISCNRLKLRVHVRVPVVVTDVLCNRALESQKSHLAEAVNRPNLTFAVSPKYLSNETKTYILITRIPRGVYIFGGFFKNFIFAISGRYLQTSALKKIQCTTSFNRHTLQKEVLRRYGFYFVCSFVSRNLKNIFIFLSFE